MNLILMYKIDRKRDVFARFCRGELYLDLRELR